MLQLNEAVKLRQHYENKAIPSDSNAFWYNYYSAQISAYENILRISVQS